jgi:prevent-host-death family protein
LVIMKKTSLAAAKARLSALVDEAEHKGRRILILRHGKPSAAIVPVGVATAPARARGKRRRALSHAEVKRLFAGLGKARPTRSAVADLRRSRR